MEQRRYEPGPGRPSVDPARCAASVWPPGKHVWHSGQCSRKRTDGDWCKQHSPDGLVARVAAMEERDRERRAALARQGRAQRALALQEATVSELRAELRRRKAGP